MGTSSELSVAERLELIQSIGEEIIEEKDQLQWLLENKEEIIAYDGFEPSGKIHIAQGLMRAINVNKLTKAGVKFVFLVADWHAAANNKYGGDLDTIRKVGDYFIEVWKACDLDFDNVEFIYASDVVREPDYWKLVLKIASTSSLNRVMRCTPIMGRSSSEGLQASQIMYPMMQAADIFYLKADICQLGMDQRRVNMLARDIASNIGQSHKPIALHHHMLMSLKKPPEEDLDPEEYNLKRKMSKSDPDSAVFMLDSKKDVARKIRAAWCPQYEVEDNPVLEYCKYILFEKFEKIEVKRPEKYGGNVSYGSYRELEAAFENGSLSPIDLKNAVTEYLNILLDPIRKHFEENPRAKELAEFVEKAKQTK